MISRIGFKARRTEVDFVVTRDGIEPPPPAFSGPPADLATDVIDEK
jgi:hypothetical protein